MTLDNLELGINIKDYDKIRRDHKFWDSSEAAKAISFAVDVLFSEIESRVETMTANPLKLESEYAPIFQHYSHLALTHIAGLAKESKRRDEVRKLMNSDDYCVRAKAVEIANDAEIKRLARDEDWQVRYDVAESGKALGLLVHDKSSEVREAVARHGYGLDVLCCDPSPFVRRTLAESGYCLDLLIDDDDPFVREAAERKINKDEAANPNTPEKTLASLARHEHWSVRREVAQNPNVSSDTLAELAQDENRDVRKAVAYNPNTPASALATLAYDDNYLVRQAAIYNPRTPADILDDLAHDENAQDEDAWARTAAFRAISKRREAEIPFVSPKPSSSHNPNPSAVRAAAKAVSATSTVANRPAQSSDAHVH